ncbi:MAG: PEGA domain-containing protein [Rubrivivax sp.]|nr:PEGA domain-containing protein [Rubrivivax sp.]
MPRRRRRLWPALPLALLLAACGSVGGPAGTDAARTAGTPITPVVPAPAAAAAPLRLSLAVQPWADARPGSPGRRVGTLKVPVFGVHDSRLVLGRDAHTVVADAVAARLQALGFELRAAPATADLRLEATLQALDLVVDARDARRVAVQAVLRRNDNGQVLWSGVVEDRDDRFAGISGNNRADLERYLGAGIGLVADRVGALVLSHAADMAPRPAARPLPVTTPNAPPNAAQPVAAADGQLAIVSVPTRVKVYVGDVYHGLTPLTLELLAGVHVLHFRRDGCRTVTEKVAVRRAATVELEIKLPDC